MRGKRARSLRKLAYRLMASAGHPFEEAKRFYRRLKKEYMRSRRVPR